ncbi:hypothetical protein [Streptomyces akebiae]|uniref:HNH endonuclease n=1 Tax=Streptomyces akebiae TaxID=2865673 RepID=A0ABX8XM70_9ACTN|nr:hypothetical protein [Streptomyces akebiae]QYX76654.1 hypothetical protein K1J60_09190 [Streptomyces akebiae]
MASSSRKEIPAPVTNRLFALSGNQCAFPACSSPVTYQEASGEKPVTLAQRAHLVGVGRQGPRSREAPLSDAPDAVENLTLFCGNHHAIVDGNPRIYSVEVLAKYKADHEERMAAKDLRVPPAPFETDSVDVSLLPVSELPGSVWRAESLFRTSMEIIERLPRPMRGQVLPFVLANGQVWAFHDLADTRGPFKQVVEPESAQCLDAAELLDSHDRNIYVWLLNSALRVALRKRGIQYDRDHGRYYFLADHETVTRRVEAKTKTGRNQSAKKVVRQEGELVGNPRDVWWHLAAQLRFEEFATGMWGLTIRPEFHLTKNGKVPLDPRRVGRKVTKRKSRMYNEGYFDAVHFFRYFLLDGRARVVFEVGRQRIAIDGDFPQVDAKWPLIDDNRFNPVTMLDSGDEDDVIDALASSWDIDDAEWDWGAEHKEDDR